ncbi:60S acidic ribosomal protein P3-like [Arachis stenosperma]|uniref:60S acidic ribosomal protein P3-like n=1 Tax=Arachis stenosperma TaxID=217475 RepID=UPI0025ACB64D|nr:60S acidic ribosomal protein P3-like [Arachis stenosperma]
MEVFTFVLRKSGAEWTVKQHSGDIEDSASSTYDLQRKLVNAARAADSSGAVQSSFSFVSPSSAVFQVVVGGAVFVGGGAVAAAPAGYAAYYHPRPEGTAWLMRKTARHCEEEDCVGVSFQL